MWQSFLRGAGFDIGIDGDFGNKTKAMTISFQNRSALSGDGVVGNATWGAALSAGINCVHDDTDDRHSANWPPRPDDLQSLNQAGREDLFGKFEYKPSGSFNNPEGIIITDGWGTANVVDTVVTQLQKVSGAPRSGKVWINKKIKEQFRAAWAMVESEGMLPLAKSWGGSYVPRFIRGSKTRLSNHAFGTAFDINVEWNRLGRQPALVNHVGCVRDLVPIFYDHGFAWGGWYQSRADGMHFECHRIL